MRFLSFTLIAAGVHILIPEGARIAPQWSSLLMARSTGIAQRMLIEIEPFIEVLTLPNEQPKLDQPRDLARNERRMAVPIGAALPRAAAANMYGYILSVVTH